MMFLCQNMLHKKLGDIDKLLLRYKELYIKTTANKI